MEYLVFIMFIVTTAAIMAAARNKMKADHFKKSLENSIRNKRALIQLLCDENKRLRKELEDKYEQIEIINKSKS